MPAFAGHDTGGDSLASGQALRSLGSRNVVRAPSLFARASRHVRHVRPEAFMLTYLDLAAVLSVFVVAAVAAFFTLRTSR